MNAKHVKVLSLGIVVIILILLILPVNELSKLISFNNLDALGIILIGAIIFALGGMYMVLKSEDIRNLSEAENNVTQLKYEIEAIHSKIDEIKKLVEY